MESAKAKGSYLAVQNIKQTFPQLEVSLIHNIRTSEMHAYYATRLSHIDSIIAVPLIYHSP